MKWRLNIFFINDYISILESTVNRCETELGSILLTVKLIWGILTFFKLTRWKIKPSNKFIYSFSSSICFPWRNSTWSSTPVPILFVMAYLNYFTFSCRGILSFIACFLLFLTKIDAKFYSSFLFTPESTDLCSGCANITKFIFKL